MKTILTKDDYDGITVPAPATEVHTSEELNDRNVELEGSVTDSGQALDAADAGQLSKTMFANGVAAQSMLDIGGVNTVVLTPITGASGLRVATPIVKTYDLLEGAIFSFKANNTNTGDMTVNLGQSSPGGLIGEQPLFLQDGSTDIPVGSVVVGTYYSVRYDSSLAVGAGAFVLLVRGYIPIVCKLSMSGDQSVAAGSTDIIEFDTIEYDPNGAADTGNYRIRPTIPGYYHVTLQTNYSGTIPTGNYIHRILKNGVNIIAYIFTRNDDTTARMISSIDVYLNGTTDYVDAIALCTADPFLVNTSGSDFMLHRIA